MSLLLVRADARHLPFTDGSVQTCVTSPPYWNLRDYGTATWAGGDAACNHVSHNARNDVSAEELARRAAAYGTGQAAGSKVTPIQFRQSCGKCGAQRIDAQLGLEPTPHAYVQNMVAVFREVWRVLRDDGTCWLNLGDSFAGSWGNQWRKDARGTQRMVNGPMIQNLQAGHVDKGTRTGVTPNVRDCLNSLVKGQPLVFGNTATIGISSQRGGVPLQDNGFPYGVFLSLLGVERVTVKQRQNDFCQVLYPLAVPCYCRVTSSVAFAARHDADLEIVLDAGYDPEIVITEHDADGQPVFGILGPSGGRARERHDGALAVEEAGEPIAEVIASGQSFGNPVPQDAPAKRFPDVYFVDQAVALGDRLDARSGDGCDLRITQASEEQVVFTLGESRVQMRAVDVSHFFVPNAFGSLVRYPELYDKARRTANARRAKQEVGIPEMVKRALMEDGWICRSTIIWSKPNPMPESVTDRPTKAHEYVFLLSKSERYYFDADAVREPHAAASLARYEYGFHAAPNPDAIAGSLQDRLQAGMGNTDRLGDSMNQSGRNVRSVWHIATQPYPGAHFATMPEKLVERCVLAGSKCGDIVLDPFIGSGTVARVALRLGRKAIGCDLNAAYLKLADDRTRVTYGLPLELA